MNTEDYNVITESNQEFKVTYIVFETARAEEAYTGVSYKNISNVVRGKNKTAGGYHWEYADS